MASVNKVILVGNLGRDPEMRTFPSGDQVANVTIATTDKWRDKTSGENREATEWHRVVFNGRLAEIAGQYLRKGSQVYVEGSIRTRKWTDPQSGQDRYATEIRADTCKCLAAAASSRAMAATVATAATKAMATATTRPRSANRRPQRNTSHLNSSSNNPPHAKPLPHRRQRPLHNQPHRAPRPGLTILATTIFRSSPHCSQKCCVRS